ncbi:MAG: hypothetical protein SFU86_01970 [Pirellulaceae bacterium]|nr:hypothetical protein [Pirellulaceae bacterium]
MTDEQLATVDPLAMNLIVAKGIPALSELNIARYQVRVNALVVDFSRRYLPSVEKYFHRDPQTFENDIRFFRLGMIQRYLELEIGIEYNRDQRNAEHIWYINPSDLFLNGLVDTRQGTCGNMAALHVAMAWRLQWPVSLACVNNHFICRFDDGTVHYNTDATPTGKGGFKSDPDDFLMKEFELPAIAITCGSDLRALRPREVLGAFVALRARHCADVGKAQNADDLVVATEPDWLLARHLFPKNRGIYKNHLAIATMFGDNLFDPDEQGHPNSYARMLQSLHKHQMVRPGDFQRRIAPIIHGEIASAAAEEFFFSLKVNQ